MDTRRLAFLIEVIVFGAMLSIVVYAVILGFFLLFRLLPTTDSTEAVTRYETVIGGQVVTCERRVDRARGTRTTAC